MANSRATPSFREWRQTKLCCVCRASVELPSFRTGCLERECGNVFCATCERPVCPWHAAVEPADQVLLFSDGASHRTFARSGGAYQLMNGEGRNIRTGGANFDLAGTPAQSEYVALLVGCLAWAQVLVDRELEGIHRPTTLWAFSDNRIVVDLAASSMGGHPRTRSTTDKLATWQHLAPHA